jgi:hypothetical protein
MLIIPWRISSGSKSYWNRIKPTQANEAPELLLMR